MDQATLTREAMTFDRPSLQQLMQTLPAGYRRAAGAAGLLGWSRGT